MASKKVTCYYCKQPLDLDSAEYVIIPSKIPNSSWRRYAHLKCSQEHNQSVEKEKKEKDILLQYISTLLGSSMAKARINQQLKTYFDEYHYSASGIYKALKYFYEVKGNDVRKANGAIGIVPFIYQEAYDYYFSIWMANQKNEAKPVEQIVPVERVIVINEPVSKTVHRRKLFSFLDKDEDV